MVQHKTHEMLRLERRFGGEPIERLFPRLRNEELRPHAEIISLLQLKRDTYFRWWRKLRAAQQPPRNGSAEQQRRQTA